jgi:AsmA protein
VSVAIRLKRLTAGALVGVGLGAGALFIAPQFVSDQEARLAAMRALRSVTGIEPQIAGSVSLTFLPIPAVRIEEVRLDDGKRPAFIADTLHASVRLLPLFLGRVEIASLTFERPHLTLDIADNGAVVVGLPLRRTGEPADASLPEVRFVNGTVHFKNGNADRSEPLSNVDAALAWSGTGVTATGSFRWRKLPVSAGLFVNDLNALERGDRSAFRVRLDSDVAKFGFDGGIAYRNGIQAEGVIAAEADSLRAAIVQLAARPPFTRGGFGPFKLKAQAAFASNSLSLKGLTVELDGNRADGGLTLKQAANSTVVQATLASDNTDFTPYSGGFAMTDADGRDWSREPIDLSGLDGFDLDVRFSAARVQIRKTELSRVAATATIRNGAVTVSVGDAQFHGGALKGRVLLGPATNGEPQVKIEGSIANFNLAPGFSALANLQRLEGKGTLALAIESSGTNMQDITRDLAGTVTLAAAGGAIIGINVEQVLGRIEKNPLSGSPDFTGGRTVFDRLNAKLRVADGTARVEEAEVQSPQMQVKLSGEASVVRRDFDLRGTATLVRSGVAANAAQPFELPFLVRGQWDRPYLMPDPAALIRRSGNLAPVRATQHRFAARMAKATESRSGAETAAD